MAISSSAYCQSEFAAVAQRADAIAVVEVAFVPYGDLVLIADSLHGETTRVTSANDLLGDCLPGKAGVRKLAADSAQSAQIAVYKEAIERATYKAVIFLQYVSGDIKVLCSNANHSTENWESDPRHPSWRARLDAYLESGE